MEKSTEKDLAESVVKAIEEDAITESGDGDNRRWA